jgi:hypothetical protein
MGGRYPMTTYLFMDPSNNREERLVDKGNNPICTSFVRLLAQGYVLVGKIEGKEDTKCQQSVKN